MNGIPIPWLDIVPTLVGQRFVLHLKKRYGSYFRISTTLLVLQRLGKSQQTWGKHTCYWNTNYIFQSAIQRKAEEQWRALPDQFRLETSLKQCAGNPFERDFLAHVRLNHLHVLFLLRLLLLNTMTEPDIPIIETAGQMLALVVEAILLRDQLTNSGTGLIWKVTLFSGLLRRTSFSLVFLI